MTEKPLALLINPAPVPNPFSLAYVAAYSRAQGFEAEVLDFALAPPSLAAFTRRLTSRPPCLIGISAYQSSMSQVVALARLCKQACRAPLIIGGPQVPGMPDKGLSALSDIDFLCRGEGEIVFAALLRALSSGGDITAVPGISYKTREGSVCTNPSPAVLPDLDSYPSPYLTEILRPEPGERAILFTSRGCPYQCTFCVTPFLSNRRMRYHSFERVLGEMAFLNSRGVRRFWLADPLFSANRARLVTLLQAIASHGIEAEIWCETRADLVDEELLGLMKRAGVVRLAFGLESSSPEVLENIKKQQEIDQFTKAVQDAKGLGIEVDLLHMYGLPGDTLSSVMHTFEYIRRSGFFFEGNTVGNAYRLYFGSEDSRDPAAHGFIIPDEVLDPRYPPYLSAGSHVRTRGISPAEREQIESRRAAEIELATLVRRFRFYKEAYGLTLREILALPWDTLSLLYTVFGKTRTGPQDYARDPEPPLREVFAQVGESAGCAPELTKLLPSLALDFTLALLSTSGCPLEREEVLEPLLAQVSSSPLYAEATVAFTLTQARWREGSAALQKIFSRFYVKEPYPLPGQLGSAHCRLLALLDVTASPPGEIGWLSEVQTALSSAVPGAIAVPCYWFHGEESVRQYQEWVRPLERKLRIALLGIAQEQPALALRRLYAQDRTLPPLHLLSHETLFLNAQFLPQAEPPTRSLDLACSRIHDERRSTYLSREGRAMISWEAFLADAVASIQLPVPEGSKATGATAQPNVPEVTKTSPVLEADAVRRGPCVAWAEIDGALTCLIKRRVLHVQGSWAAVLRRALDAPTQVSELPFPPQASHEERRKWLAMMLEHEILEPAPSSHKMSMIQVNKMGVTAST